MQSLPVLTIVSKQTKQLWDAREVKRFRQDNPEQQELDISTISTSTLSDYDSDGDSSFDPESEAFDEDEAIQKHIVEISNSCCSGLSCLNLFTSLASQSCLVCFETIVNTGKLCIK